MKLGLFIVLFVFGSKAFAAAPEIEIAKTRCLSGATDELLLYSNEFKNPAQHLGQTWWWTLPELEVLFPAVYSSGKRLPKRAYYDSNSKQFILPMDDGTKVVVAENFILSVQKHVEVALQEKYAEFLFFPDMGHNHFYFPRQHWNAEYANFNGTQAERYTKMLADPELHALYHTAEKLLTQDESKQLLPDPHIQFRYANRNILGGNKQQASLEVHVNNSGTYNTVSAIDGYESWSAGINISASETGCFVYYHNGQPMYFDISLYDLVSDPQQSSPDDYF